MYVGVFVCVHSEGGELSQNLKHLSIFWFDLSILYVALLLLLNVLCRVCSLDKIKLKKKEIKILSQTIIKHSKL